MSTLGKDANGHPTLDGQRWHWATHTDPAVCAEKDCDYVMKKYRDAGVKPKFRRRKKDASDD